jgi:pimeloyl-ACP methyl ester carboxylesterase
VSSSNKDDGMLTMTGGDGVCVAYLDERPAEPVAAPPILLIHGFASNHAVNWVFPQWVKTLSGAGHRVILYDVRGHGRSDKPYEPEDYRIDVLAAEALALLDHLSIPVADVMGYSMGARISAFLQRAAPERVRSVVFGGLGYNLVEGASLPMGIADAMDAPAPESLEDPTQRMFRAFADATKSDRRALAACIRGARQSMAADEVAKIACQTLVAVGTDDEIGGDPQRLAALMPKGRSFAIERRDHNKAVGDRTYKQAVLDFLQDLK